MLVDHRAKLRAKLLSQPPDRKFALEVFLKTTIMKDIVGFLEFQEQLRVSKTRPLLK